MFPATRRSAVFATRSADPVERRQALDILAAAYWKPVKIHVRAKWRRSEEDAQDLTQAFFARAMEKQFFEGYDPSKASFRTYLRMCLDGFVSNELKAAGRQKRAGDVQPLPLDFDAAAGDKSLDEQFHEEFVRSVFALAVERLHAHCAEHGRETHFQLFSRYDLDEERVTYQKLAQEFNLTAASVTNYLALARREFRCIVLETLRELTATEREFREEARFVLGVQK